MNAQTPMLQQYFRAKEQFPGVLLAMRVGDFYEFYGDDADAAAAALEITLTGREDGSNGRISMAGVPFHAAERYFARLISQGIKVAVCDQLEDPKKAKGLVKRGVTRVFTPGTILDDSMLPGDSANFLAAVAIRANAAGVSFLEPSTGEFLVTELSGPDLAQQLATELAKFRPAEILGAAADLDQLDAVTTALKATASPITPPRSDAAAATLMSQLGVTTLDGFGIGAESLAATAAAIIVQYAQKMKLDLSHATSLTAYSTESFMSLDSATRRSLELTANLIDGGRRYTLLDTIDCTVTPMGARLLKRWLDQPLLDIQEIKRRQAGVETIARHNMARGDLRDALKRLADIERLVTRVSTGIASPRDVAGLKNSLNALPLLADPLRILGLGRIQELREDIGNHEVLAERLQSALVEDPPAHLRDGGVFNRGFNAELDELREMSVEGKRYITALESAEREKTGISTLKVGYNSVFGYYLEVPKSQLAKVPETYIRKQTTANSERYFTAELKERETQVLGAADKALVLEEELFSQLKAEIAADENKLALLATARAIAELDVLAALAELAQRSDYCKPDFTESDALEILKGRHPVVETSRETFIANDLQLDTHRPRMIVLTGPNMAGKSTYLRQTALIVLLAQIGSFVPAERCRMGICDRVFARIGARDELAQGQSTFMVEMVESANILNHATDRSLVILDEVGRGTSTYDGLAIAWAMVEHLVAVRSKTLFATHYHQLNSLADTTPEVANFRVAVQEIGDTLVWTHRVLPGGADRSYGIHVAKMAGVPESVLDRASQVLVGLERQEETPPVVQVKTQALQLTLFESEESPIERQIKAVDLNQLTPLEAMKLLDDWKRSLK